MWANIWKAGLIAGAIAGGGLSLVVALAGDRLGFGWAAMAVGYAIMLLAFSMIFLAVKRERDVAGGGVIRFWPALGMGLAITVVAGVIYVLVWELAQATIVQGDFASRYAEAWLAERRAAGASAAELARGSAEMARFVAEYRDPLNRLPTTFLEILPVGVLASLVCAVLLRNPRFMPARD